MLSKNPTGLFMRILLLIGILAFLGACKKDSTLQHEADIALIEEYMAQNNLSLTKDADADFYYSISMDSDTIKPVRDANLQLELHYEVSLLDGTPIYDTNGTPTIIYLDDAIIGWQMALPKMSIGDEMLLILPSRLAYGEEGTVNIPANSILVFNIELLEIYPHF